jgi:type IV pilus assembly protein PilE
MKKTHGPDARHGRGFTLIELMITVAIVAILAAVAYPSYQNHVVRTHRTAAKACLSELAQFMERYYTSNLTYVGASPSLGCTTDSGLDNRYSFPAPTGSAVTRTTYTLTAVPAGTQTRDTQCGTLSITHAGVRSASGSLGTACW